MLSSVAVECSTPRLAVRQREKDRIHLVGGKTTMPAVGALLVATLLIPPHRLAFVRQDYKVADSLTKRLRWRSGAKEALFDQVVDPVNLGSICQELLQRHVCLVQILFLDVQEEIT